MSEETILLIEDDALVTRILKARFRAAGYDVVSATDAGEAIQAAIQKKPDVVVLDLTLLDGGTMNGLRDGMGVLQWLHRALPEARCPVIIHTADTSPNLEQRLVGGDVTAVFRKGSPLEDLLAAIRSALDKRKESQDAA